MGWVAVGEDSEKFWRLTLREVKNVLRGHLERKRRERNEAMSQAWHTASFHRAKKMPKLKDLLERDPLKPKRRQTVEEQIAIAMHWTAALTKH